MTAKQAIRVLRKMLEEAHHAIKTEIEATADDDHPMIAWKIKMLNRHEKRLATLDRKRRGTE